VVPVGAAAAFAACSKNITISKSGGEPGEQPVGAEAAPVAPGEAGAGGATSFLADFDRLTRVTPSTLRRRAISVATSCCVFVQPVIVIAGASIALRRPDPPVPPTPVLTVPSRESSVTSDGIARERSRSAVSQSKRLPARSLTVATRAEASAAKSEYGLRSPTLAAAACSRTVSALSWAWRSLTVLSVST
jgi:hypothetical protein